MYVELGAKTLKFFADFLVEFMFFNVFTFFISFRKQQQEEDPTITGTQQKRRFYVIAWIFFLFTLQIIQSLIGIVQAIFYVMLTAPLLRFDDLVFQPIIMLGYPLKDFLVGLSFVWLYHYQGKHAML